MPTLPNDTLVFLAEPPGAFGLYVGGKLYVDDVAKILAQWITRNEDRGVFNSGPVRTLPRIEWDQFQRFNLRNEPL